MRLRNVIAAAMLSMLAAAGPVFCVASVFSSLHGVVHDEQHFPVKGAEVAVRAAGSSFEMLATTNADGEFEFNSLPLGVYRIHIEANGFASADEVVTVLSNTHPAVHFALAPAGVKTTITVSGAAEQTDTVTP